jgi:hypothetical protein
MPCNKACKNSQNGMEWEILYLPSDVPKETRAVCSPFSGSLNLISSPGFIDTYQEWMRYKELIPR